MLDTSLIYFHEVAQCGSVRRAAERLHVSASAISRMVSKLEHRLQAELFERQTRGMVLTAAGRVLAEGLSGPIAQLRDAQARIDEIRGLRRGEVALHCIEGLINDVVPRLLSTFHASHPGIVFSLSVAGSDDIVQALLADRTDIGITYEMRRRREVEVLVALRQEMGALIAADHPLAGRASLSLHEIAAYPLALSNRSFGARQMIDRAFHRLRIEPPVVFTANSLAAAHGMARFSHAIAFAIPLAARLGVAGGGLRLIPVREGELLAGTVALCVRRGRRLPTAASALAEHLGHGLAGAGRQHARPQHRTPAPRRARALNPR